MPPSLAGGDAGGDACATTDALNLTRHESDACVRQRPFGNVDADVHYYEQIRGVGAKA